MLNSSGTPANTGQENTDTTLSALTPEGIEYILYPAGLTARGTAFAIDSFIQRAINIIIIIFFSSSIEKIFGIWIMFLFMFTLEWFYYSICEVFFNGQSIGKKCIGLRVVQNDGSPVHAAASILRNLLRSADTFLSFFHIALITISVSKGFRRIGDIAAGTIVVYTSSSRFIVSRRQFSPAKTAPITPPRRLSLDEKQTLASFAQRYALLGKERADEIVLPWTDSLGWKPFSSEADATSPSEYALGLAKNRTGGQ
ncbi:MAG: RDD family protein [Spirochaetaceae bacterium]|jgi:uncharacterized RDD family membrane protein YckC|nr:RDD family protein [Spirochaetaceae bacterium]